MKKSILILATIAAIFLIASCRTKKDDAQLVQSKVVDSLHLEIPHQNYSRLRLLDIDKRTGLHLAMFGNTWEIEPVLYFFKKNQSVFTDSINLKSVLPENHSISKFKYFSKDSILLFLFTHEIKKDSLIILTNNKAELLKVFPFNNSYIPSSYNKTTVDSSLLTSFYSGIYKDKKFFFSLMPWRFTYFKADSLARIRYPLIAYYDFEKDSIITNNEIWFPNLKTGFYAWNAYSITFCLSPKGNPIIGFSYTPQLLEWDLQSGKTIKHRIASLVVDSILPTEEYIDQQFSDKQAYYSNIWYNLENRVYIRKINFPQKTYGNFKNIVVYADNRFNYIGENNNYNKSIVEYAGWSCNYKNKKITDFVKLKYNYSFMDTSAFRAEMMAGKDTKQTKINKYKCSVGISEKETSNYKDEYIVKYLRNRINIADSTYSIFIVQNNACQGCVEYIYNFFMNNKEVLDDGRIYLLVIDSDYEYANQYLENYNLLDFRKLKRDSVEKYSLFNPFLDKNPRLVLINDLEVVLDSVYQPGDQSYMVIEGINFSNYKVESD